MAYVHHEKAKPVVKAEHFDILNRAKDLGLDVEKEMDKPGSAVSKIFGCKCDIIQNGGGEGDLDLLDSSKGKYMWKTAWGCFHDNRP